MSQNKLFLISSLISSLIVSFILVVIYTSASTTIGTNIDTGGTLTVSGNVGIGTTTPSAKLDITGENSTATLGSEMIVATVDQAFTGSLGNWTAGTNWAYGTNNASHTAGTTGTLSLANDYLSAAPASGNIYKIVFTANTATAGTIRVSIGGANGIAVGQATGADTQTQVIIATGSGALTFTPNSAWAGTIDDVSVIQITPSSATQIVRNSDSSIGLEVRAGGITRFNTFIGTSVGKANTTGNFNTALGYDALRNNTTGSQNTANGFQTLIANTTGAFNTANGYLALNSNTIGKYNTAIGVDALLRNTLGRANTASGMDSLAYNTTGYYNVATGVESLLNNTTGYYNVGTGVGALSENTTGSNNIALGFQAGDNLTTGSNNIIIGYDINAVSASSANTLNIGNLVFGTGIDGTGSTLSSGNIGIGTTTPIARFSVKGAGSATGRLLQLTDSNNVEKITVLDNGNVGIGTTTPTAQFQVATSTANATTTMVVGKTGQNKGSCIVLYDTAGTAYYCAVEGGVFTCDTSSCE